MENTMATVIIKRWDLDLSWERELCARCCIVFQFIETVSDGISVSSVMDVSVQDPWTQMRKKWIFHFSWLISYLSLMFCRSFVLWNAFVQSRIPSLRLTTQKASMQGENRTTAWRKTHSGPLQICIWWRPHIRSQNPVTHIHAQTHQACSWEHLELESIGSQTTMLAVNQSRRRQI